MINTRSGFRVVICAAVLVLLNGMSSTADAAIITLNDVNSIFKIEPRSGQPNQGAFSWEVDGTEHLFKQWFWYRANDMTAEQSIDTLPFIFAIGSNTDGQPGLDRVQIQYQNSLFRVDIRYDLMGGPLGSQSSTVMERITITNRTTSALFFHFFEYDDFNVNGDAGDDTAALVTTSSITQTDPEGIQATVTVTPPPNAYEIAPVNPGADTLTSLNDGTVTVLSNTSPLVGPDDVAFAFEWDPIISPNGSFVIQTSKVIGPGTLGVIPEPGALLLLGSGLVGLYWRQRPRST